MNRRHFLTTTAAGVAAWAAPALGRDPIRRPGKPRFLLGLSAYSFRQQMRWFRDKESTAPTAHGPRWEITDFIDYCAEHEVPGAELTSYFFPPDADAAYFHRVRQHAFLRGVQIPGTAIGNTFTHPPGPEREREIAYTKKWIDNAVALGAPHIRVFAGNVPKGHTPEEAEQYCLECYRECLAYAAERGVWLGLENHGGIVAKSDALVRLMKAVDSPWAGINLDSGNFNTVDPYADLAAIAPYAVNVQIKERVRPAGDKEGHELDAARFLGILREANYQGWVSLEYEEKEDAFTAVPRLLNHWRPLLAAA